MTQSKFFSKSLKTLNLPAAAGIPEVTQAYIKLTGSVKFKKIFILNEELREEFIKYHEAYVVAIRELSEKGQRRKSNSRPEVYECLKLLI